jgi:hypothetical protein
MILWLGGCLGVEPRIGVALAEGHSDVGGGEITSAECLHHNNDVGRVRGGAGVRRGEARANGKHGRKMLLIGPSKEALEENVLERA